MSVLAAGSGLVEKCMKVGQVQETSEWGDDGKLEGTCPEQVGSHSAPAGGSSGDWRTVTDHLSPTPQRRQNSRV